MSEPEHSILTQGHSQSCYQLECDIRERIIFVQDEISAALGVNVASHTPEDAACVQYLNGPEFVRRWTGYAALVRVPQLNSIYRS